MDMTTVNVATLKQKLSEYLRRVEEGDEIVVTSHRRNIARMIPEPDTGVRIRRPVQSLKRLAAVQGVAAKAGYSAVESLLRDRSTR